MTFSSRSTSAVGPVAISLPKSSTAVVVQHACTRLMSWSTRITSAPNRSGILWITPVMCSVSSSGSPAAGSSSSTTRGRADDGPGDLDEAPVARAEPTDLDVRRHLEAHVLDGAQDVGLPRRAARTRVLVDHRDVVEHRQLLDRHLGLERAPQPPARAAVVDHLEQVVAECADRPCGRLDEAAQDVEERRLSRPVRPDQAARAAGEDDADVVDRRHAGEADGQPLDLDHDASRAPPVMRR